MLDLKFNIWLKQQKKINKMQTYIIDLFKITEWKIDKDVIFHKSKKFFKIVGLKIKTNFFKKNWDQPIIVQNEVGILGIIKNLKTKKYLLQAKAEPGNKNKLQLSPTVQATQSNYRQIHGGKKVPYLNFFLKVNKKKDFNQSEQGFRYFRKYNSNILINTNKKIKLIPGFIWVSQNQLIKMINVKNLLNMDTVSVISSNINRNKIDTPVNENKFILQWFKSRDKKFFLKSKIISLAKLEDWEYDNNKIYHKNNKHFTVIGVKVKTNKREVNNWSQPIIKGKNLAIAGFILKKFNNTTHYLCRYILKPGLRSSVLSCTVNTSEFQNYTNDSNLSSFQKKIIKNFFLSQQYKKFKIYDNIMSDEGGRFYHCEIRNLALLLNGSSNINLPLNYIWISQNQMIKLIKKKKIDIEARLLFGCLNVNNLK